ncbi:tRNA pseudouridine synthase 1 [Neopestalotiopsis sp. 37M]|nr:tRNA pseudouridine synthase 1 [Neopestalotiopsis sp. 37M]
MAPESESRPEPQRSAAPSEAQSNQPVPTAEPAKTQDVPDGESSGKRKFEGGRGGRGGRNRRGGGRGGKGGGRKHEFTHKEANEQRGDKRERQNDWRERKRLKVDESGRRVGAGAEGSYMSIQFPKEEIEAEERRPKRKVAVMIGYAGTGYHGLQINHKEKTIEGDLFGAFVAAKAISKVNADDPRKSSLVRTARTDKGVHAAGNVISLKLIIEDPDILQKINDALPPQIRVWGIQRTNNSFSCYQACDSRWYEYLMPSYCLLPPHPESFLGKKVTESVKDHGVEEQYNQRLADVANFWEDVEKNDIQPILDSLDPDVRERVQRRRHAAESESQGHKIIKIDGSTEDVAEDSSAEKVDTETPIADDAAAKDTDVVMATSDQDNVVNETTAAGQADASEVKEMKESKEPNPVDVALKKIKAAYVAAKRRYRITPDRLNQLQEALNQYLGTKNYHNYTVQKSSSDPSAKRTIKSFVANPEPVQINDTQWLSLKVHGQSFMMHQIRKMVGMAVLVVRCGTDMERISQTYRDDKISIPKAPSLGLLLERPVFHNYNQRATDSFERPAIDFGNYEKEIQQFKNEHIYQRIFDLEEKENSFHTFFHQIDHFKSDYFLWVTAGGIQAARKRTGQGDDMPEALKAELDDDEGEDIEGGEG